MKLLFVLVAGLAALAIVVSPRPATAQSQMHPRWEIPGFDFRKDGVWRVRARRVAELRRALLAQRRMTELNAPVAAGARTPTAAAVSGALAVPFILLSYPGIDSTQFMRDTSQYSALLFGASPPPGLPYSLNGFYQQLSDGLFGIQGTVSRWTRLADTEVTYTGTPSTACQLERQDGLMNCNGIWSTQAITQLHNGLREALALVDGSVNFALFDNDGPDGLPNSGDDDGFVDLVLFGHATRDGACGGATNNHIWSHRFALSVTSTYTTNDARTGGGNIRVSDYLVQSALGGANGCDSTGIMPIGTAAHELGHGLGLPDLYDFTGTTFGPTEGIGQWGLMGSGHFTSPRSPSRMEAWSLNELGWVTVAPLTTTGTYSFGAAPVSDTAFLVNVQGTNTRNEYFLIENRQASQADTALMRIHCQISGNPPGCAGGLLIWHADGAKLLSGRASNTVNNGTIHGLALMQADGLNQLSTTRTPQSRGDAGDPYPGTSGNSAFSFATNPAALKNLDGSFVGFAIDSIRQVVPGGEMALRLRFGRLTVARGSDSTAVIQVDGGNYNVFRNLLEDGSTHTLSVADTQLSANERTRWRFASWSDGGSRTHDITGSFPGATYIAALNRDFWLIATATAGGTVSSNPSVNLGGAFLAEGTGVQLTATPNGGFVFDGWTGDTTSSGAALTLGMGRPYTVTARFTTPLALTAGATRPNGVMGAAYDDTLRATGGTGAYTWSVTGGALPQGVTLNAVTGVLSGFPRQAGAFSYQARVVSGLQSQRQTFTFSVTAPTLAMADVMTQLLGPTAPLTADQLRYLDYLGNNNGTFDIGDFLAWVKATGAP